MLELIMRLAHTFIITTAMDGWAAYSSAKWPPELLPVLQKVGFAATVPEARDEVFAAVHHVTQRSAGFGAVRDVIEQLLHARGLWPDVLRRYEAS